MSKMGAVAIKADDLSLEKYRCYFCDLTEEQQEEIAAEAYKACVTFQSCGEGTWSDKSNWSSSKEEYDAAKECGQL